MLVYYKEAVRAVGEEGGTAREVAEKVKELHPEFIEQKNGGVRQVADEIGSIFISRNSYERDGYIAIRDCSPMRVVFNSDVPDVESAEDDYSRSDLTEDALREMTPADLARLKLFKELSKLITIAGLKVDVDHATSLHEGRTDAHTPDNLQLLTASHNRKKSKCSIPRLSWEQQEDYILRAAALEKSIGLRIDISAIVVYLKALKTIY